MNALESILKSVLMTMYEQVWISLALAILFMFLYLFAKEHGWKEAIRNWWLGLKNDFVFRRMFLFVFYVAMVLLRTLVNREMWINPLSDIMGGWGIYNEKGEFTTQAFENIILFIPLLILLFWNFHQNIFKNKFCFFKMILDAAAISFICSLSVEFCQVFFRVGTFQVSDLCYNTLGGILGGIIYFCSYKILSRR